jgi:uncharacterized protein (TIGR01777 family)
MRIIITGGTGLIGSRLAKSYAAEGHEVIVLSRNPAKYTFPAGVTGVQWDSKTDAGWGHLADGADAIVNLAGAPINGGTLIPKRWTPERKQRIRQSRIDAGKAVTAAVAAAAAKPGVVVQSSGIDYYGDIPGDRKLDETAPNGHGYLADVTVDWEASTASVAEMGVRRVVIRTGIVFSMESGALPITVLPFRFFVGGPLGSGRQWWPWIHVEDEVRAIRFLIENESAGGAYNLCAPDTPQQKDVAGAIGRVLRRPSLIPVPGFALKLLLGEVAELVLAGRRAIPARLQEAGFDFQFGELEPALSDLLQ